MRFRCPNCQQQVRVDDSSNIDESEDTQEIVTCPSCNSQFNLLSTDDTEVGRQGLESIGHFEIQGQLGEGSYGTVFKAWDSELRRTVALKIPRASRMSPESTRLFLREARAAAAVSHPNVVSVHEIGQHESSIYIASQYIEGITLRDHMRSSQLSNEQIGTLLIKILRAIQCFHDKGIIHRDLKPGNILIDAENEPYVTDFGLARRDSSDEITVTKTGDVIGTLGYMSPEQARGEIHTLSSRTDVYAVGVILYEMLTRKRPFVATSSHTVLHHILTKEPQRPRKIDPGIPRDLQTICLKALEKEPDKRYNSASDMADDLQRYLDHRPIIARAAGPVDITLKLIRRNRLVTALIILSAGALAVAGVAMQRPPEGTVPVRITTDKADASIRFVRYDQNLRVPDSDSVTVEGASGDRFWLMPGLYKVQAEDSSNARHEVWRFVPEKTDQNSTEQRFPHQAWTVDDGDIVLQPFRLFSDSDVADSVVLVHGGTFQAGFEDTAGHFAAKHQQSVDDFFMGVNEVSYGQFREVMNQKVKSPLVDGTYLSQLTSQFGDRSELADDQPVSGYPVDVALVYCELAGGRLPTSIEWEYAATQGGTSSFPTGDSPAVETSTDWEVLSTTAATSDTAPEGIRNLYFSVAEYTDSRMLSYKVLYPAAFTGVAETKISEPDFAKLPQLVEVRGAPVSWLAGNPTEEPLNVRLRLVAPFPKADSEALSNYGRIGWRLCR